MRSTGGEVVKCLGVDKTTQKEEEMGRKPQRDEVVKGTGQVEKEEPVTKTVGEERLGP